MKTCINSEIGKLEAVIIHTPGSELENMTPENAERALYSDILNLPIASQEYAQLAGILKIVTGVFEIKKLLADILGNEKAKTALLQEVCNHERIQNMQNQLVAQSPGLLAKLLIEGVVLEKNNLTNYLSKEKFLMRPLHNLFFTRDSAMGMNNYMLTGRMANPVREREAFIVEAIFNYHPLFDTETLNPLKPQNGIPLDKQSTLEGGDFLVIRDDIFLIGKGMRTSTQGIDFVIEHIKQNKKGVYHLIVQELPSTPESFIHLDMVFTMLSQEECMVYEPVVYGLSRYKTIYIRIDNGKIKIKEQPNIPEALKKLGVDLKTIFCGGKKNSWTQEREQWHSGANFLAFAPGKIIGYERNVNTTGELSKNGYEIIKASDAIREKTDLSHFNKCAVLIAGSELARGGGGARCMTMPLKRAAVT